MLLLTNQDVLRILTMEKCLEAVEESTRRIGQGQLVKWNAGRVLEETGSFGGPTSIYTLRLRRVFDLVDGVAILRLNSWSNVAVDMYGKTRHVIAPIAGERNPHNSEKSGWLHLYDMATGRLLAIVQDRDIQVMRVGSVGGLCAKYMARSESRTIGVIGAGWMARTLLLAHCLVRDIKSVKVYSPNPNNRSRFCEQMKMQLKMEVEPVSSAQEAARGTDILISGTNSAEPTFDPEWIEKGMHVHCVTGAEYDERMVEKADLVAWTYPESSQYDYGGDETKITGDPQEEKLAARKRGYAGYRTAGWRLLEEYASKRVYLTDIIQGRAKGRDNEKQITFSPSPAGASSLVIRFAVLLPRLYEEAKRRGIGHDLPDDWFHQEDATYPDYQLR